MIRTNLEMAKMSCDRTSNETEMLKMLFTFM